MSLSLTHILLYGTLVQRLVCRPPDCHTCGWKLEAVKGGAGDPPASYVQVITGLTRPLRGNFLFLPPGAPPPDPGPLLSRDKRGEKRAGTKVPDLLDGGHRPKGRYYPLYGGFSNIGRWERDGSH